MNLEKDGVLLTIKKPYFCKRLSRQESSQERKCRVRLTGKYSGGVKVV